MTVIGNLVTRFTADMSGLKEGVAQYGREIDAAEKTTKSFDQKLAGFISTIGSSIAIITTLVTVSYAAIQKYGTMANQLQDLSLTTGMTQKELQQMQYAALLSGNTLESITPGINKLTLSMAEFSDGSSAASKAFYRLGIDPTGKSTAKVFDETTRALIGVKDETQRNAIAMDLYGRNWKDLLPVMETYIERKDEIAKSPALSDKELENLRNAKTEWDKLNNSFTIYSGNVLSFISDVNSKYNEIQTKNAEHPGPINSFLEKIFGSKSDARSGAGGRGGAIESEPLQETILKELPDEEKQKRDNKAFTDSVDNITDAMHYYKDAIDDVKDAQEELNDINRDYARELQLVDPRDASSVRNLMMRHEWAVQDQQEEISKAQEGQVAAGANVGKAAMGMAGITITGPIYLNGDKSFEKFLSEQTKSMGVPNR